MNKRTRQRFDLSLDGRQAATIVVVFLLVLGGVFLLGTAVGRTLARRSAPAAAVSADPLAALDENPAPAAVEEPPTRYSFHERLTREPPRAELAAAPAEPPRAVAAAEQIAPPKEHPEKSAPASAVENVTPPPAPAQRGAGATASTDSQATAGAAPEAEPPSPRAEPAVTARTDAGPFTIQLGATRDAGEAGRIARKFKAFRPKIVGAAVPGKGHWYRVRVGTFASRDAADRYLRDLRRETGARGFVTAAR